MLRRLLSNITVLKVDIFLEMEDRQYAVWDNLDQYVILNCHTIPRHQYWILVWQFKVTNWSRYSTLWAVCYFKVTYWSQQYKFESRRMVWLFKVTTSTGHTLLWPVCHFKVTYCSQQYKFECRRMVWLFKVTSRLVKPFFGLADIINWLINLNIIETSLLGVVPQMLVSLSPNPSPKPRPSQLGLRLPLTSP